MLLVVATLVVIMGCGTEGEDQTVPAKKHHWPMTREQLSRLRRMPRGEREAWFADLELPSYAVKRREGDIVIDGVLDEPAWKKADVIQLREGALGGPVRFGTRARMLWDDDAIYVAFECDDPDVHAPLDRYDDDLWKHDLVELFIDTVAEGNQYMELHAAPSGALADVIWADFIPNIDWFTAKGWEHFEGSTPKQAFQLPGMTMKVKIDGTLNIPADTDKGYTVEWRIPFAGMRNAVSDLAKCKQPIDMTTFEQVPIEAPKAGAVWRMNFNRCDDSIKVTREVPTKDGPPKIVNVPEYSAWAPTTGSNHMPFLFGHVTFVE